jgi:hypothetical protein
MTTGHEHLRALGAEPACDRLAHVAAAGRAEHDRSFPL